MGKIALFYLLPLFYCTNLFAQKPIVVSKRAYGLSFSAHHSMVTVKGADPDNNKVYRSFYPAFNGHFVYQKRLNGHDNIEFGVGVAQQGFRESGMFRDVDGNLIEGAYFLDKIYHFQMPLRYNVLIWQKEKWKLELMLGGSLNLMLIYNTITESPLPIVTRNVRKGKTANENFSIMGGFHLNYELNGRYSLRLSPYIENFLKPQNIDKSTISLFDTGLQLAIFKRI